MSILSSHQLCLRLASLNICNNLDPESHQEKDRLKNQEINGLQNQEILSKKINPSLERIKIAEVLDYGIYKYSVDVVNLKKSEIDPESYDKIITTSECTDVYAVLPFIEISLDDYMKLHTLSCDQLFFIIKNLLLFLSKIHNEKYLHLDLKPENLLLQMNGQEIEKIVVIDFELSKKMRMTIDSKLSKNYKKEKNDILGTPGYMSPEAGQDGNTALTVQSDIWSLGKIICRLLLLSIPDKDFENLKEEKIVFDTSSGLEISVKDKDDFFEYLSANYKLVDKSSFHNRSQEDKQQSHSPLSSDEFLSVITLKWIIDKAVLKESCSESINSSEIQISANGNYFADKSLENSGIGNSVLENTSKIKNLPNLLNLLNHMLLIRDKDTNDLLRQYFSSDSGTPPIQNIESDLENKTFKDNFKLTPEQEELKGIICGWTHQLTTNILSQSINLLQSKNYQQHESLKHISCNGVSKVQQGLISNLESLKKPGTAQIYKFLLNTIKNPPSLTPNDYLKVSNTSPSASLGGHVIPSLKRKNRKKIISKSNIKSVFKRTKKGRILSRKRLKINKKNKKSTQNKKIKK